ncbi:MAG: universal stress protein [Chloroflexi bacterium]|nr:universal stress protein [Chloroflexota bacterium]
MAQTVLVPLDGSEEGLHALPFARAAVRILGGRIVLLRVLPTGGATGDADTMAQLDGLVRLLARESIQAEAFVRRGSPEDAIRSMTTGVGASLIVMASHQRRGLDRWFGGSVTESVIHGARVPVLMVPLEGSPVPADTSPARVMVPLDGSAFAEAAVAYVRELASHRPLQVLLARIARLHVVSVAGMVLEPPDLAERVKAEAARMDDLAAVLRADGIDAIVKVVQSVHPVAAALLELASQFEAHAIMMATHGRGALAHLALGSVSTAVLEQSTLPVLLIPGPRS